MDVNDYLLSLHIKRKVDVSTARSVKYRVRATFGRGRAATFRESAKLSIEQMKDYDPERGPVAPPVIQNP